jgi:hypothetical protein
MPRVPRSANPQSASEEGFDWGIDGHGRNAAVHPGARQGRMLLIDIEARDKAARDCLLPGAGPIVDSFEFRH